jgi:hypothetical protein
MLLSCGGRTSNLDAVATSTGGTGGAAGSGPGATTSTTQGAGGTSSIGSSAGRAGAPPPPDPSCYSAPSRCGFGMPRDGEQGAPCPRPFDPNPVITATGSSVLSRIADFLEDGATTVSPGDVPAVATAKWASSEATSILDHYVARGVGAPGFVRVLSLWLDAPASLASLSNPLRWPFIMSTPGTLMPALLIGAINDPRRPGILTEQDLLALRPGISARGAWLYQRLLCQDVPPPPPNTPPLKPTPGMTRRESLAALLGPSCVSFEHFDEMGNYRDVDNGKPVDSSGIIDNWGVSGIAPTKFQSIDDLAFQLSDSCGVARCFAAAMFNHALNVSPGAPVPYSEEELDYVANRFADSDRDIRTLVGAIVESPTFLR